MARVAEQLGWQFSRARGDHMIYAKPGERLQVTIPDKRNLPEGTVRSLVKSMGLTVDEFLALARNR